MFRRVGLAFSLLSSDISALNIPPAHFVQLGPFIKKHSHKLGLQFTAKFLQRNFLPNHIYKKLILTLQTKISLLKKYLHSTGLLLSTKMLYRSSVRLNNLRQPSASAGYKTINLSLVRIWQNSYKNLEQTWALTSITIKKFKGPLGLKKTHIIIFRGQDETRA